MILQVHFFHVILPNHTLPIPNHCLWHHNLPLLSILKQCHENNIKFHCQLKMEPVLMDQLLQPLCIDQEETLSQAVTFSHTLSSSFLFHIDFCLYKFQSLINDILLLSLPYSWLCSIGFSSVLLISLTTAATFPEQF